VVIIRIDRKYFMLISLSLKYPDIFSFNYRTGKRLGNSANQVETECQASDPIG
jgi:hypothetical protein